MHTCMSYYDLRYTIYDIFNGRSYMYNSLYELIMTHIYDNVVTADSTLVCTFFSTFFCILLCAMPFVIVYKILRMVCNY